MSQRDREGRLALKPRLPHNQRTYPSDCKAGARKSRPPWGKVAPTGDGRGELAGYLDCHPTSPPTPATAKQEPEKKPSPLGEGGRREPDGRGELALKPRLPPNKDTEPSLPSMELRGLGGELRQVTTTTRFQRNHQPPYFLNSQNHAKITPESTRDRVWLPPNQPEGR